MSGKKKKEKRYRKGRPEAFIFFFLLNVMPRLPLWFIRVSSWVLFYLFYPTLIAFGLTRRFKRNVAEAFREELARKEIAKIARKSLYIQFVGVLEATHYYHPKRREELFENVTLDGFEKIEKAKKDGKGVIGVTAHLGNFLLLGTRLGVFDKDFWFLVKNLKLEALNDTWYRYMDKIHLKKVNFSDRTEATKGVTRVLTDNGFVMMVADEYYRKGIPVTFFGRTTRMAVGPAVISLRTGAPLIPMFIIRGEKSRYRIIFDKRIEFVPSGDTDRDVSALTQLRTDVLEKYVRMYPEQWLWLHSRWRG
jgi:KDO2-lipid IV(A) lauroyltransferase